MRKLTFNQSLRGRWLLLLFALLLLPSCLQAEDYGITIAGIQVTDANAANITGDSITAGTVSFDAENNILTLTGATIKGEIRSTLESLTINLVGSSQLKGVDNQNSAIQNDADMADLSFTGSGSLAISASGGVIYGFSSVDFGSFNLASQAAGVHYDDSSMRSYDGYLVSDLTITTDEVYPIWVFDSSLGEESTHRQITASNKGDVLGNGTISLSGSTITLNGATIELGENSGIVVGQGVSSLTVHLLGTNIFRYGPAFYFVDKTNLIFTTDTSNPGSLEAPGLADWADPNDQGEISYKNGLVHTMDNDKHYVDRRTLYYGLNVAGIRVSNLNADDILNDGGSVSYEQDTWGYSRILTLNNATINGKIDIYGEMSIDILGNNTITSADSAAINNQATGISYSLTFRSTGNTLATLTLKPGNESFKAYEGFNVAYYDNTALFGDINEDQEPVLGGEVTVKKMPAAVFNFPQGIVFTDEDLTITMDIPSEDYDIYWTGKSEYGQYKKYTGPFRLTTDDDSYGGYGNPSVYAYTADKEQNRRTIDVVRLLIVVDRPTFSVAGGEYATAQQVAIEGLPELETRESYVGEELQQFPQVWYYLDDDKANAVQYTGDTNITIDHTCRLNAYLLAVNDSGIVVNSNVFYADYIVRQEPGYYFSTSTTGQSYYPSGSTVSNLNYGEENTLPWLINVPDGLAISYRSSDENTATIDEEGHITLTGAGFVKIYASNEETDEYVAHEEWIMLEIRPSDPQSSIEQGAYYTGQELVLTPTVPNGEMYYQIGWDGEKVKYTKPLVLEKGKTTYKLYTLCSSEDGEKWSYGNNHPVFYVYDELTFTPESGASSNDDIVVEIGNLPEATDSNPNAVSVYYYFGEDETKAKLYSATDKATVAESTKLNAYIEVEGDSGVYKTEPVKAEYTVIPKTELNISYASNSRQWASYYADEKSLETPEGLQANIVTAVAAEGVMVSPIDYIPQNVPILLKRTAQEVTEPIMAKAYQDEETADVSSNKLAGTAENKAVKTIEGNVYVLYNDGFTRATSGSIPAHRAYLVISDVDAGARLWIWDDEDATRISTVGRGFATTSETLYNLNGQRVSQPSKGLYISNGKKRIVK